MHEQNSAEHPPPTRTGISSFPNARSGLQSFIEGDIWPVPATKGSLRESAPDEVEAHFEDEGLRLIWRAALNRGTDRSMAG